MQDIDFDELDRAVNSVIGPDDGASNVTVTQGPSERPSLEIPERNSSASPAARRSGRFMDVVHPSSDMRSKMTIPERPKDERSDAPANNADSFKWPDPLDLPETHAETDSSTDTVEDADSSMSLESPFLPDAKVEKRPLGAPIDTTKLLTEELDKPVEPVAPAADEAPVEDETNEPVPAELNEEVVKLEEAETPIEDEPSPVSSPVVEAPAGPASITQQYKEQPSTTDQPSGAIFDTEAYHQPLTHTPKKHAGIFIVVWILALVVVGGGAGAAVYFFVLPML